MLVHSHDYAETGPFSLTLTVLNGCDSLSLGSAVVRTQEVAHLALNLVSGSQAYWISFTVTAPTNLLNNASLTAIPQFTNATVIPGPGSQWFVTMQTDPANGVGGVANIGLLSFNAVATRSAFVPVSINNLVITNQSGVPGATGNGGRVVIVADQSLLEASMDGDQRILTIYGKADTTYEIDYSSNLAAPPPWLPGWTNVVPLSLSNSAPVPDPFSNAPILLLRAVER
jgi:hypothetical protein